MINHYAGSNLHGMEYRHFSLAREGVRSGHAVKIVAASFSHLRSREVRTKDSYTEEEIEGVRYAWLRTPRYDGNGVGRAANMVAFGLSLLAHRERAVHNFKPDVVIASSPHPFVIFGAVKMARASAATIAFEVRDLWPLTLIELGGMSPRHPFVVLMQWAENYAYRKADLIISLLPRAEAYMKEHGMAPGKFVYLPNGINAEEWDGNGMTPMPQEHAEIISRLRQEGRFLVGYAGAHGIANELDTLIRAASLVTLEQVVFILVGQGPEKENLVKEATHLGVRNVVFLPPVKKTAVPALLTSCDALYIGLKKEPLFRFGVSPNKLMDYMMAAKPIIYAIKAGNDSVTESCCGVSVPPEEPEAVADAVMRLMNMGERERTEMGLRGRAYVLANHDYRSLARRFLAALC